MLTDYAIKHLKKSEQVGRNVAEFLAGKQRNNASSRIGTSSSVNNQGRRKHFDVSTNNGDFMQPSEIGGVSISQYNKSIYQNPVSEAKTTKQYQNLSQFFQVYAKKNRIDTEALKSLLPCSLEAVDHLDEIYVMGTNKLEAEVAHA